MTREIRVTIDDDEVFERMRSRKRSLDLSWEEVLHRGLREEREPDDLGERIERQVRQRVAESLETAFGVDDGAGARGATGAGPDARGAEGVRGRDAHGARDPEPPSPPDPPEQDPSGFGPDADVGVETGTESAPATTASGGLDAEMASLANAEDAVLRFPFLDDEPGNRVPLRVRLETTAEGLDVTVVAIRTGKSVAEYNAFDRAARPKIAAALADDRTARLVLGDGAETYHVVPALSWQATPDGPTVTEAAIREVRVDA